ncbi:hypothetical protein ACN20G_28095 (plasmid) [Streptomyces sp. BI20]|uniref:hypothetical protein n=1 Tax=Streptomyces sp. BI20 TaxID=3403460 RepID=UPI003C76E845
MRAPIESIAATTRAKFDGYNMRFGDGRAVHAVTLREWRGELLPAPACHVGNFGDIDHARREWGPVSCGRAGCREHDGRTGTEAAYAEQVRRMRIILNESCGPVTYRLTDCLTDPRRRAALVRMAGAHPVVDEAVRRYLASEPLHEYAARIAEQRRRAVPRQLDLFDVA